MKNVTSSYLRIAEFEVTVSSLIKCFTTGPCYSKKGGGLFFFHFEKAKACSKDDAVYRQIYIALGQHKNI